jgi:hypothetical protein
VKVLLKGASGSANAKVQMLLSAVRADYGTGVSFEGVMGRLITSIILDKHRAFTASKGFEETILSYPMFGADVALVLKRAKNALFLPKHKCRICNRRVSMDLEALRETED